MTTNAIVPNPPEQDGVKPGPPLNWPQPLSRPYVQGPSTAAGAHAELAHDARNLLAAMGLYCDLLAQPGVLNRRYAHYAGHLKVVIDSGISLVGRLVGPAIPTETTSSALGSGDDGAKERDLPKQRIGPVQAKAADALIDLGVAIELRRGMLSVLLGAGIALEIECQPCLGLLQIEPLDLDRILVNLIRNAGEAMPKGGRVRISVQSGKGENFLPQTACGLGASPFSGVTSVSGILPVPGILDHVGHAEDLQSDAGSTAVPYSPIYTEAVHGTGKTVLLCVHDNGSGINRQILAHIFDTGFSSKPRQGPNVCNHPDSADAGLGTAPPSRGLGLGIVRSLVEAAGGQIRVVSRLGAGTRFEIEFPVLRESLDAPQPPVSARAGGRTTKPSDQDRPAAPAPATPSQAIHNRSNPNRQSTRTDEQEGSRVQC